jgi:hypothetical protein
MGSIGMACLFGRTMVKALPILDLIDGLEDG